MTSALTESSTALNAKLFSTTAYTYDFDQEKSPLGDDVPQMGSNLARWRCLQRGYVIL